MDEPRTQRPPLTDLIPIAIVKPDDEMTFEWLEDPHGYRGTGKRYVPVLADYADTIRDAVAGRAPDEFVFLPGRSVTGRSCASDFIRRVRLAQVPVTLSKMRTTWIVRLMKAHIPEAAICDAAGLSDLQHYVKYRERVSDISARAFEDQIRYAGTDTLPSLRVI